MRLKDLDARFLKNRGDTYETVEMAKADGIIFQCPKCSEGKEVVEEGGRRFVRGPHYVICWFVGRVLDEVSPKPGRWTPSGSSIDDLTFVPGDPPRAVSVLITTGCGWHGHVVSGEATLS